MSRTQSTITWMLVVGWVLLMIFAALSVANPPWLQALSQPGIDTEARGYKDCGDQCLRDQDFGRALWWYDQALCVKADYAGALVNLAITHGQMGNRPRGVQLLRQALENETKQREVILFNLADLLAKQGEIEEAIQLYRQALESSREQDLIYSKIGALHATANQTMRAREAFEAALLIQKDPASAYLNMLRSARMVYAEDTTHLPAIEEQLARDPRREDLERYEMDFVLRELEQSPNIARTHGLLGMIHVRLGNREEAIENLSASLEIWHGNPDAPRLRALLEQLQASPGE